MIRTSEFILLVSKYNKKLNHIIICDANSPSNGIEIYGDIADYGWDNLMRNRGTWEMGDLIFFEMRNDNTELYLEVDDFVDISSVLKEYIDDGWTKIN